MRQRKQPKPITDMQPAQIYKTLLNPKCTATLVTKSRQKMLDGNMPTINLQRKAIDCAAKASKQSSPPRLMTNPLYGNPKSSSPKPAPRRIVPIPVSIPKPALKPALTQGQKTTAHLINNLITRIENKHKADKNKHKIVWRPGGSP